MSLPAKGDLTRRQALRCGAVAVSSVVLSKAWAKSADREPGGDDDELIRDPHFQAGFILLDPQPGRRVPSGQIPGHAPGTNPVWDLAQWSSKFSLAPEPPQRLPDGALRYANQAKAITFGQPNTDAADLSLAVNASVEYGTRARQNGEPWVHLLVQQNISSPPTLAELEAARFHVEAKLQTSKKIETPEYTPSLHAAQFQAFFSVQNLNRASPGYGQYLWFGIPIYDSRHRVAPEHKAQDTGGTNMFIFTPPGDVYTKQSAHDGAWLTIDKDLLPLMRKGLETAWQRDFLNDSKSLTDYRIAGLNLGWELTGIFDVSMQVRNISLNGTN